MMMRLNLLLLLALTGSALYVVHLQNESRLLSTALLHADKQAEQLELEYTSVQAEYHTHSSNMQVHSLAQSKLQMRDITLEITHFTHQGGGR